MMFYYRKIFTALALSVLLLVTGCTSAPPSEFDQAQQESTQKGAEAVSESAEKGGSFNKFFPKGTEDYEVVFAQEKKGFAQAKLKQGSTEMALMSVSDIESTPAAAKRYQDSQMTIKGYPAAKQGETTIGVLVADRFQVKVQSRDPSFSESDRKEWLEKFDFAGIEALAE